MKRLEEIDKIVALARYFLHAKVQHENLHFMRKEWGSLSGIHEEGHWLEFETYLGVWLSTLYVVVEGYRELKISDPQIDSMIGTYEGSLKLLRNGMFHFQSNQKKWVQFFGHEGDRINWAEELHAQFLRFFLEKFTVIDDKGKPEMDVPEEIWALMDRDMSDFPDAYTAARALLKA